MANQLPLSARVKSSVKQPQELTYYSLDIERNVHLDDSQLSYYYLPESMIDREIDLNEGFENFKLRGDHNKPEPLDALLFALINYEKKTGQKAKGDIISWRGTMTNLLCLPEDNRDGLNLNLTYFDGQIFIESLPKEEHKFPNQDVMMYWGYKFEAIATLPKPWSQCSREEIEETRLHKQVNNFEQFCSIVRTGVGSTKVILAGEVDCTLNNKPSPPANSLENYMELKTSRIITDQKGYRNFDRKLMRTWAQSFLLGVPHIVYGFRDDKGILRAVEHYKTENLPIMVKNSPHTSPNFKWNGMNLISFYGAALEWIKTSVAESRPQDLTQFRVTMPPKGQHLEISQLDTQSTALTKEFIEWRLSQRSS